MRDRAVPLLERLLSPADSWETGLSAEAIGFAVCVAAEWANAPALEKLLQHPLLQSVLHTKDGSRRSTHERAGKLAVSAVAAEALLAACGVSEVSERSGFCNSDIPRYMRRYGGDRRCGARGANASDGSIPVGSGILLSGASGADRAAVVDVLLRVPGFDPSQWPLQLQGVPLRLAATHGWLEVVDRLLADPRIDPTADNNAVLMWAIDIGAHAHCVAAPC